MGFLVGTQLHDLVGNGIHSLVPGNWHKPGINAASFLRVGPLHRHLDSVRVIGLLDDQVTTGADIATIGLGKLVAPHLDRPSVLDVDLDGAPGGTALAGGGHPLARRRLTPLCFSCGKGVQLGQPDGCYSTGSCRYLQKIPAINLHTVSSFRLWCRIGVTDVTKPF